MTIRETLRHLYNFYAILKVTHTPDGLFLPLSYATTHKYYNNTINYYSEKYIALGSNPSSIWNDEYNAVVGIYDAAGNMVWCNATLKSSNGSTITYPVGNLKVYKYGVSTKIARPGMYYSRVIFSGYNCLPKVQEVPFEVVEIDAYNKAIEIDHGFYKDNNNKKGIWYIENAIPEKIDMIKYAPKE